MRTRFILCLALIAAAPLAVPDVQPLPLTSTAVPLNTDDLAQSAVGGLRYLGGLVLNSTTRSFGGLSGLRAGPGGRLLAISDNGNWVSFVTVERGDRLVGVRDGVIAPLLDASDRKAASKSAGDAESLDWNPATGAALVSFEQDHRIQRYLGIDPARPDTLRAMPAEVIRNPATAGWPANGGGEALAVLGDGSRVLFEEDGEDANGLSPVLLVKDGVTKQLLYRRPPGYKPTDAVEIAPGNAKAHLDLGNLLLAGHSTDEARKHAEIVLHDNPQNADADILLSGTEDLHLCGHLEYGQRLPATRSQPDNPARKRALRFGPYSHRCTGGATGQQSQGVGIGDSKNHRA